MNQILISKKLYVTPDMKKKKKVFKFEFFLSVFLVGILSSYAIYAEYDRNRSEQVSKELLGEIIYERTEQKSVLPSINTDSVKVEDDIIVVILNKAMENQGEISVDELTVEVPTEEIPEEQILVANNGIQYYAIGEIKISSININYPILTTKTPEHLDALLKISVCKFYGANPNQIGNLCIAGHNYKNSLFFSKVPNLELGEIIEITDLSGTTLKYSVYDKYIVNPEQLECTSQLTEGKREITLITCTNDNKQRHIIKAREIETGM
ncbi:MAG: sortase [Clostridia bacterium]|nr:sortase [Clostridia bacterium]